MSVTVYDALGYYTADSMWSKMSADERRKYGKEETDTLVKVYNALTVSGYFPLIGAYVGYQRVSKNISSKRDPISVRVMQVVRGVLEILGLGILFLIPDLIVSFHRHFCAVTPDAQKVRQ